ncbi:hypothetical protein D9756_010195 [Leucocoprinus leucothites]|uniref:Uncharacterized protein n=1 Tax=Leucocoprinus leucothites TaxID=201217 RepID=A0A8H5FSX9_9AGAR|nr:hypothetical protein D9756_010195 [Leucoagaricus leucothites]
MAEAISTSDIIDLVEVRAFTQPNKAAKSYYVRSVNGIMDLCSNPTLINESGFPEVFQAMYDPLENVFVGIHPWGGLYRVDNILPFWIMKRQDLDVEDCPHLHTYCDIVEDRWIKLHSKSTDSPPASYEYPSTPLPSTLFPSTPFPLLFPSTPYPSTPYPSTLLTTSPVPPLPSLSSSPVPLLPPLSLSPVPHLPLNNLVDNASARNGGSPDNSQASEGLGKRKRSHTPFSIGSIGTMNITINVKEEAEVNQESAKPQLKKLTDQAVQAGPEIIILTDSEDEVTLPKPPLKKRILPERKGRGKARKIGTVA